MITQEQIIAVLKGERVVLEDGQVLGWRVCHPDLRSSRDYRWPWPGGVATADPQGREYTRGDPCPQFPGDGLCIAKTWAGAASGGIPAITGLIVAYAPAHVLGEDADKLRVSEARVLEMIDMPALLRSGHLGGANLGGANLGGANLGGAYLGGANLGGAYLEGAYLGGALLRSGHLGGANLEGANLRGANLEGANLEGANLGDYERGEDGFARLKAVTVGGAS